MTDDRRLRKLDGKVSEGVSTSRLAIRASFVASKLRYVQAVWGKPGHAAASIWVEVWGVVNPVPEIFDSN